MRGGLIRINQARSRVCQAPVNLPSKPHYNNPCPTFPPQRPPPLPTSNLFLMPPCRHTTIKPGTSFSTTLLLLNYNSATHLSPSSLFSNLSVLQDLIQKFDQRRTSDERLKAWLNPTVNVLYSFSATLSEGVGLVSITSLSFYDLHPDHHLSGILTHQNDICWHWCPSVGERPHRSLDTGHQ